MAKLTRALRFEITFPGWRPKELFGVFGDPEAEPVTEGSSKRSRRAKLQRGLFDDLWSLQSDLTAASNRLMSALYQVKLGTLAPPEKDGKPVHLQTLAYQGLSGAWQPFPEPIYAASVYPAGSHVLLEVATRVYQRLQTDFFDVKIGKRSLASFRGVPIAVAAQSVRLGEDETITLTLWKPGSRSQTRIKVRPRKLDAGQRAILRRMISGEYRHGPAQLSWYAPGGRKGKWMISLPWTGETAEIAPEGEPLVVGVHLGMLTTASLAYATLDGKVTRHKDLIDLPENAIRAWNRLDREKRERLRSNAKALGLREGRGRVRKLRVAAVIGDSVARVVDTAVDQTAARVVAAAVKRGAVGLGIEKLTHWSVRKELEESDDLGARARARHRRWYFEWKQGALRAAIKIAAEREGLAVFELDAAYNSRDCSACGSQLWRETGVYAKEGTPPGGHGRITWNEFRCSCGCEIHADRNAAINMTKRTLAAWRDAQKPEAAK